MTTDAKICGLKTVEDLDAAIAGGAAYIGLVFCEVSPRHLEFSVARRLAEHARGKAKIVALSVDADDAAISAIVDATAPDILQLHGRESPARVAEVKSAFGHPVIKALPIRSADDLALVDGYIGVADLILFDAKPPEGASRPGGHGRSFDWTILRDLKDRNMPYMLSGGLHPDNVGDAIQMLRPAAVDVSSGVESAPGIKDAALIERFLRAVKTANQS